MKALDLEKMENIGGGHLSQKECAIRGLGIGITAILSAVNPSFLVGTIVLAAQSGYCF